MAEETLKTKVANKLNLAGDIKEAKIQTSIGDVKKVDGKISARFDISGLPTKNQGGYSDSYKTIPKIFDTIEGFSEYATMFFNASDDEIIGKKSSGLKALFKGNATELIDDDELKVNKKYQSRVNKILGK